MKVMKDPVFGQISFDGLFWIGEVDVPGLRRAVLAIDTTAAPWVVNPGHEPSDAQRVAFQRFLEESPRLMKEVETAVFAHYRAVREAFARFMSPDEVALDAPELAESKEIWHLLRGFEVFIPPQPNGECVVLLRCGTSWDSGPGIDVVIRDGYVAAVARGGETGYY